MADLEAEFAKFQAELDSSGSNGAAAAGGGAPGGNAEELADLEARLAALEEEAVATARAASVPAAAAPARPVQEVVAAAPPQRVIREVVVAPPRPPEPYGGGQHAGAYYGGGGGPMGGFEGGPPGPDWGAPPGDHFHGGGEPGYGNSGGPGGWGHGGRSGGGGGGPAGAPPVEGWMSGPQPGTAGYQATFMQQTAAAGGGGGAGGGAAAAGGAPKVDKRAVRMAGGDVWTDKSLADWPEDDHRIFVGDLGPEANDELLFRLFKARYPSVQRARVVKDRYTNRDRGYGFVSFADPFECVQALKEMDGKYCGSRPMKLKKSTWKDRMAEEKVVRAKRENGVGVRTIKRKDKRRLW